VALPRKKQLQAPPSLCDSQNILGAYYKKTGVIIDHAGVFGSVSD